MESVFAYGTKTSITKHFDCIDSRIRGWLSRTVPYTQHSIGVITRGFVSVLVYYHQSDISIPKPSFIILTPECLQFCNSKAMI